jgi:hypothetical protein
VGAASRECSYGLGLFFFFPRTPLNREREKNHMPAVLSLSTCRPTAGARPVTRRPPPRPRHSLAAAPTNGTRVTALFKGFRGNSEDAGE